MGGAFIKLSAAIHFGGARVRTEPMWNQENETVDFAKLEDAELVAAIYDRYASSLFRLLVALLGRAEDAEDALGEVFLKIASRRFPHVKDTRAYLFQMARHQAIDILRRRQREAQLIENCADDPLSSAPHQSFSTHHDWQRLLTRLPLEQREIIALKIWEGMTFAEIADVVKAPPNTVASRYRYGIERLRKWCEEEENDEQ